MQGTRNKIQKPNSRENSNLRGTIGQLQNSITLQGASLNDIILKAIEAGINKEEVEPMIQKLKSAGEII